MRPSGATPIEYSIGGTVTRTETGFTENYGAWTEFYGAVQPLNGSDIRALPEGESQERTLKIYTNDVVLSPTDEDTGKQADRVRIEGEVYKVIQSKTWGYGLPHSKVIVTRVQE